MKHGKTEALRSPISLLSLSERRGLKWDVLRTRMPLPAKISHRVYAYIVLPSLGERIFFYNYLGAVTKYCVYFKV